MDQEHGTEEVTTNLVMGAENVIRNLVVGEEDGIENVTRNVVMEEEDGTQNTIGNDSKNTFIIIIAVGVGVAFLLWFGIIIYVCYAKRLYGRYTEHSDSEVQRSIL